MPRLLSPEVREYVNQLYLQRDFSPREISSEIADKFGVQVTSAQLRQYLSRSGLAARRREVSRQVGRIVGEAAALEIAKGKAAKPEELLQAWARQFVDIVDKSLAAAAQSDRVRDLAAATSAAASAVKMFKHCLGIDQVSVPSAFKFDFNFGSLPMPDAPAIDVDERPTLQNSTFSGIPAPTLPVALASGQPGIPATRETSISITS